MRPAPSPVWPEVLAAGRGCLALLRGRVEGLSGFDLSPSGLASAALACVLSQTLLVALLYMISGDRGVSASVVLASLWGATALREAVAYVWIRGAGRSERYFVHGVPALWVAAIQPISLIVFTLALFVLSRMLGMSGALAVSIVGLVILGLTGASMTIAVQTLWRGVGMNFGAIVGIFVVQAFSLAVSFVGFGFALQLAGYSTATR